VVTKNAGQHLPSTLNSLLTQSLRAQRVVVVDDGSTDNTPQILNEYSERGQVQIDIVTLPDKGYDIRRVPQNLNLAWHRADSVGVSSDFLMVSGDDCYYPSDYAKIIVSEMSSYPKIAVASGQLTSDGNISREHVPAGSGRFIRSSFWREIGGGYPVKAGWESWLLYKALEKGYDVRLFDGVSFAHAQPRGAKHQFAYWGAAMQALGYHPLYALGRIAKNTLLRSVSLKGSVNMLRGYLEAQLGSEDPFITTFESSLREFVRREQVGYMSRIVMKLFRGRVNLT
jgi:glycosyltransferase involved in cell wall biosynthesis